MARRSVQQTAAVRSAPPYLRGAPVGRRIHRSVLWLGGVAVLVILGTALAGENGLRTYIRLRHEKQQLAEEVAALQERRAALEADLAALRSDPEALEKIAREKYRMRRPGERVIEIVGEEPSRSDAAPRAGAQPPTP